MHPQKSVKMLAFRPNQLLLQFKKTFMYINIETYPTLETLVVDGDPSSWKVW